MSPWANPCTPWAKGPCTRGVNCWFKHGGVATHTKDGKIIKICVVCKSPDHTSSECRAPGGKQDPDHKHKHWDQYRERKAQAAAENPKGKGQEAQQPQQPKGKAKGKGGQKGAGQRHDSRGPKGGKKHVAAAAGAGGAGAAEGALAASSATPGAPCRRRAGHRVFGVPANGGQFSRGLDQALSPGSLRARSLGQRVLETRAGHALHRRLARGLAASRRIGGMLPHVCWPNGAARWQRYLHIRTARI